MANRLTDPFQTGADVHFPSMRPDWRDEIGDEPDPDDELIETPDDVIAVLGFDPAEKDEEMNDKLVAQFAEFDESKRSRVGKGESTGGRFAAKGGGGDGKEKGATAVFKGEKFRTIAKSARLNLDQAKDLLSERGYELGPPQTDLGLGKTFFVVQRGDEPPQRKTAKELMDFLVTEDAEFPK